MSQIRNDIDELLKQCDARYEKEKAALGEENKLMRDRRTRRRASDLFFVVLVTGIGIYLLCIFLAIFITGLLGMFEDAIEYFVGALIICFDILAILALAYIIIFIMRKIKGAPEHLKNNAHTRYMWTKYHEELRAILSDADNKDKRFVKIDTTPQYFKPHVEIKAHKGEGAFVEMKIVSTSNTPFLKSIYGSGSPSSEMQLITRSVLDNAEDVGVWQKIGAFTELELPYVKVSLFPEILGNEWTYLLPQKTPAKEIEDVFDKVCRMIIYDIIRKKLKKEMEREATVKKGDAKITQGDLSPYFTKHEHMDKDLQAGLNKLEDMAARPTIRTGIPVNIARSITLLHDIALTDKSLDDTGFGIEWTWDEDGTIQPDEGATVSENTDKN